MKIEISCEICLVITQITDILEDNPAQKIEKRFFEVPPSVLDDLGIKHADEVTPSIVRKYTFNYGIMPMMWMMVKATIKLIVSILDLMFTVSGKIRYIKNVFSLVFMQLMTVMVKRSSPQTWENMMELKMFNSFSNSEIRFMSNLDYFNTATMTGSLVKSSFRIIS